MLGAVTATDQAPQVSIAPMVDGTANRPLVYRQLAPLCIRLLEAVFPRAEEELQPIFPRWNETMGSKPTWWPTADLAPLAFSSALYTLCILLIWREKWRLYIAAFTLAVLNKETSILLIAIFVLAFRDRRCSLPFARLAVGQIVLYALITGTLRYVFANNPGQTVERQFVRNVRLLANPPDFYDFLLLLFLLAVLVARDWEIKPVLFRRMLMMLWPLLILTFFFGWIDELRDYYDVYPAVIALASIPVARYIFQVSVAPTRSS
jgi:hypothetical protein